MKKYNGTEWVDTTLRQYKTATDTLTTFPADVYADGNNATVGISGNTVQSGTPTPDNPIMPQVTGERTGNLWGYTIEQGGWNASRGTIPEKVPSYGDTYAFRCRVGSIVDIPSSTLSLSCSDNVKINYVWIDENGYSLGGSGYQTNGDTATAPNGAAYMTFILAKLDESECTPSDFTNIMLVAGSTALPYEPYGYKIPISSAGQTTPVYLGEVETTRQIRKLVMTGEEDWNNLYGQSLFGAVSLLNTAPFILGISAYSTHYRYNPVQSGLDNAMSNGEFALQKSGDVNFNVFLKNTAYTSTVDFKSYLAQQYAAGTPVTVWYVLAEPETGIVNEPLMKIGDYADTVSGITVPTITSKDTFDVDTTLKPSEVSLSYTGWHDAEVKEKSTNLFDYNTVTFGKYIDTNGNEQTSSGAGEQSLNHSDFIAVTAETVYTFKCEKSPIESATFNAFCWFDSNKQFIKRATFDVGAVDPYILGTATAPINAAYLIMNYRGLHGDTAMLNTGSTALPYEPYWK